MEKGRFNRKEYTKIVIKEIINKHLITIPEKEVTYEYLFFNK